MNGMLADASPAIDR